MPVYVDNASLALGRMLMCHLIADTPAELAAMVDAIGVDRKWFQRLARMPHFDIAKSKRKLAIAQGAIELDRRAYVAKMREVRRMWPTDRLGNWEL